METKHFDLAVIGGGPAGYVAAIRGSQLGAKVALIEKDKPGGTCLNYGCVPTKALLYNASKYQDILHSNDYGIELKDVRLDYAKVLENKKKVQDSLGMGIKKLIEKNKITYFDDKGTFENAKAIKLSQTGTIISAKKIIIATGAKNVTPPIEGIDSPGVMDSKMILNYSSIPKSLLIIGGGVIGLEMAEIFNSFGSQVTVVEMLPNILDEMDPDCAQVITKLLEKKGIKFLLGAQVLSIKNINSDAYVAEVIQEKDSHITIEAEKVLVSVGRKPYLEDLGLDKFGEIITEKGAIKVNQYMQTVIPEIYAAGDVLGKYLYAHVAYHEGRIAAENAMGLKVRMDYSAVPKVVFTNPQVGSVGLSEQEAMEKGYRVKTGLFPLAYNSQALVMGVPEGFVKYIVAQDTEEVLGLHIVSPHASDLIVEGTFALNLQMTLDEIAEIIHVHPSLSETLYEAALVGLGQPLHS